MGPFTVTEEPEIGNPIEDDPNQKKSNFARMKEKQRLERMHSDRPKYNYTIQTIAMLVRCSNMAPPSSKTTKVDQVIKDYQIDDLGYNLTENDLVLWNPKAVFIRKLFAHCRRNKTAVELSRAYMHFSWVSFDVITTIWEVVSEGIKEKDFDGIQPFLIML
jgi:hypothetical protein